MTMQDAKDLLRYIGKEVKNELWPDITPNAKYTRYWTIGLSFLIVIGGSWYFYRGYMRDKNEAAFAFLSDYAREYGVHQEQAIDWAEVADSFSLESGRYRRTAAAPYFSVHQADQLLRQGKKEEALSAMQEAVAALSKDNPLFYLYKTKVALIQLDLPGQQEAGLSALAGLAGDEKNTHRDLSAYQLGLYYWATDSVEQAKTVWQELVGRFDQQEQGLQPVQQPLMHSPWVEMAREKLALIA